MGYATICHRVRTTHHAETTWFVAPVLAIHDTSLSKSAVAKHWLHPSSFSIYLIASQAFHAFQLRCVRSILVHQFLRYSERPRAESAFITRWHTFEPCGHRTDTHM